MVDQKTYRAVRVEKGPRGWGGPLVVKPEPGKQYVVSITGGGIHPIAQRIADMTGGVAFDGFKSKVEFNEMACAVIDCGGTARVGVYPMKKVLTIDIHPTSPAGPLMQFITEQLFVSGVKADNIQAIDS
jgi:glucitol/sorbitol PTS system EIIB component